MFTALFAIASFESVCSKYTDYVSNVTCSIKLDFDKFKINKMHFNCVYSIEFSMLHLMCFQLLLGSKAIHDRLTNSNGSNE